MSSLSDRLSKIEDRLQSLIEQGTTRLIPHRDRRDQIHAALITAVQRSIRKDEAGTPFCADTYIIKVGRELAQLLGEDPTFQEELLKMVIEAGAQSRVNFNYPPRVKISLDETMVPGNFEIIPLFSMEDVAETNTIVVEIDTGMNLPGNAFLIGEGNQVYTLQEQVINLGRRADNHIVIDDPHVSRQHAQLRVIDNRYVIFDLESAGGTFVNNSRVEQATLFPGDVISLAGAELVYGQDAGIISGDGEGSTRQLLPVQDKYE